MKRLLICVVTLGMVFGAVGLAMAANTDTQVVGLAVSAINEISVSGSPSGILTVSTATAGAEPDEVTDASTTYQFTTNKDNMKITGELNSIMPDYTVLKITLDTAGLDKGTWTPATDVSLDNIAQTLATGGKGRTGTGKTITYKFSATVEAGDAEGTLSGSRTVTLTLTDA